MSISSYPEIAKVEREDTKEPIYVYLGYSIALIKNLNDKSESFDFYPRNFFEKRKELEKIFLEKEITLSSVAKPFQLLTCLELGLDYSNLTELAILSSSHSGTQAHISLLQELLKRWKIDYQVLKSGIHEPLDKQTKLSQNPQERVLQNNCAGKHLAMIRTCQINGWEYKAGKYLEFEHPLQKKIAARIKELAETEQKEEILIGRDGCQSPCYTLKARALLKLFSRLSTHSSFSDLKKAFLEHNFLISGAERVDYVISELYKKKLLVKSGSGGLTVLNFSHQEKDGDNLEITLLAKIFSPSDKIRALFLEEILDLYLKGVEKREHKVKTKLLERESFDLSQQYQISKIKLEV